MTPDFIAAISAGLAYAIVISVLWHLDSLKANEQERIARREERL